MTGSKALFFRRASLVLLPLLLCACGGLQIKQTFEEAHELFEHGNYKDSLSKYEQIIGKHPAEADRVLFEMGIIYSHPKNEQRDFEKSTECFQRIVKEHPRSWYRQDSQMMIFYIQSSVAKDETIAAQKATIETLKQEAQGRAEEIAALERQKKDLEQRVFSLTIQRQAVDKVLILKKERSLSLMAKGEVLKTYKIALGGNPDGPKDRQGDNKTPEGTYHIDGRNTESRFHLSLHISYPNERDKKRAKELGVPAGGNIMIHGIKNGFARVGDAHSAVDWTKGCIAVTDEEIEEIARAVPNGTTVEIRP